MSRDPGAELVDVLDDAGRPVATVTRREMRARRLAHGSTYVLVFNRRGELFVHLRAPDKDVFPGHWDVAIGGVIAAGESFDAGARSAWHSHDNGQLLMVEKGRMRTQKRGQPMRDLAVGESDYTGPNVQHWRGSWPGCTTGISRSRSGSSRADTTSPTQRRGPCS